MSRRIGPIGAAVLAALILSLAILAPALPIRAECPDRPACRGCGCKGGPGYRRPDGRCVGFRELDKVCGRPPETRCRFENAPGTGANRDCARNGGKSGEAG